jgi:MFS transporter, PAT family, beta-lactamase induction signal transducer AmpG
LGYLNGEALTESKTLKNKRMTESNSNPNKTATEIAGNVKTRSPWAWVPSLYFAEGIPYVIVMTLSVIMYKRLGVSNTDIALYTSWLYLPWVIKPLWSPFIDLLKTKRYWIVIMQLMIGAGLAGVAFTIPVPSFFQYTLAFFWLLAFSSATHDIAADGFYMMGLDQGQQAYYVGIRSTFYRFAMLAGQGLLVILAGSIETSTGKEPVYFHVHAVVDKQTTIQPTQTATSNVEGFSILEKLDIAAIETLPNHADSLKKAVREQNIVHGFYQEEKKLVKAGSEPGLWSKYISSPLAEFVKKNFGKENVQASESKIGNLGVSWIKLNKQPAPDEKIIVNLSRHSGSSDINIAEGTRFEFSDKNWDKPAYIVFQLDPKLDRPAETVFIGRSGNIALAWTFTFIIIAAMFVAFSIYHRFILPRPAEDQPSGQTSGSEILKAFFRVFGDFFRKKQIGLALGFLLVYRLAESQLVKLASPFLLDSTEVGGLGLTTGQLGFYYGTIGIIALTLGGIIGGILVSRNGLKYWIWWMVLAINVPDLIYVYFAMARPESEVLIALGIGIEQLGYGFGFTAFMMYTIYIAEGKNKTAHYAIATGFMALGMMLPGMFSGWLQELIGYESFFIWVMFCTIPGFIIVAFMKIEPDFGKIKKKEQ